VRLQCRVVDERLGQHVACGLELASDAVARVHLQRSVEGQGRGIGHRRQVEPNGPLQRVQQRVVGLDDVQAARVLDHTRGAVEQLARFE
jgi:hypothetical protein